MPRARDIGWEHGKMVAEHRHHVQCNYCHRIMIGGITRFKKHLASRRGEIKGCEAVPKEVRELIEKHLVAWEMRKTTGKKRKTVYIEPLNERPYDEKDTDSDDLDQEITTAKLESMPTFQEAEETHPMSNDEDSRTVLSKEIYDPSAVQCKNEQVSAPARATDLGWVHGMMVNGDQQKIKCKYCQKMILGGGISRLKHHLAGERGNIAPCDKVPEDVKAQIQQHLGFKVLEKLKKQKEPDMPFSSSQCKEEESNIDIHRSREEWNEGVSGRRNRQKRQAIPVGTPIAQPLFQNLFASQGNIDQVDMAVAKFMHDVGIPFSAANSSYFQQMADAIAAVGPGYKMPSYHSLRGDLLNRSAREVGQLCQELRKSWEVSGCSVMADKWTDRSDSTYINFSIYCSKGTMFLKSVDASEISKSPSALLSLFDGIVQEVGSKNIVHFITDTTPNYKKAGKMLMDKYKTFFWSACAVHCIDLMFVELGKMTEVKEGLTKGKRICQFIYNHEWVLDLMRKKTNGRDIVRPGLTTSSTNFLTLQSIVSLKDPLHQMFTSTTWIESPFSKQRLGLEVAETVLDPLFWSVCTQILKVTEPLLTVFELASREHRPMVGYLYDAMDKARKGIIEAFDNNESDYFPYLEVIDRIWEEDLHSPLHAAAYYLNPSIFYNLNSSTNKGIQKGLLDCIEGLEPNLSSQVMITRQTSFYKDADGDFSRPMAIRGRGSLAPATWWSLYATDYPDLQRLAIRILSQTCSSTGSGRKWSTYYHIHVKNKNRLEHQRLDNLRFVHYNLCLQPRHSAVVAKIGTITEVPTCMEEMDMYAREWIEDPGNWDENEENMGWLDVGIPSDAANPSVKVTADMDDYNFSAAELGNDTIDL